MADELARKIAVQCSGKVEVLLNDKMALQLPDPPGTPLKTWRNGAFEVVDMSTGKILYSKRETGKHLNEDDALERKLMSDIQELLK
jgi:hypothetical protein|mmetsp:Transcript_98693/g.155974  ORF Transcript_98693/g.155974 Transcript_98693/m.155974 type:complete len:86 (+) Transcript_98693:572-829(+)